MLKCVETKLQPFLRCLCTRECLLGPGLFSCNCLHQLWRIKYVVFTADMAVIYFCVKKDNMIFFNTKING